MRCKRGNRIAWVGIIYHEKKQAHLQIVICATFKISFQFLSNGYYSYLLKNDERILVISSNFRKSNFVKYPFTFGGWSGMMYGIHMHGLNLGLQLEKSFYYTASLKFKSFLRYDKIFAPRLAVNWCVSHNTFVKTYQKLYWERII